MSIRDYIHPSWWAWRYRYQPQITDGTQQRYVTYSIRRLDGRYRVWIDWNPDPLFEQTLSVTDRSPEQAADSYWFMNNGNSSHQNTPGFWCVTYTLSRFLGSWRARSWNRRLRRVARNYEKDNAWNEDRLNVREPT